MHFKMIDSIVCDTITFSDRDACDSEMSVIVSTCHDSQPG